MMKKSFIFHLDKSTDIRRDEDEEKMKVKKSFICKPCFFLPHGWGVCGGIGWIEMSVAVW
jgi:hypothetical protein